MTSGLLEFSAAGTSENMYVHGDAEVVRDRVDASKLSMWGVAISGTSAFFVHLQHDHLVVHLRSSCEVDARVFNCMM